MQLKKHFNMSPTLTNLLPICCQSVVSYHQVIDNIFLNVNINIFNSSTYMAPGQSHSCQVVDNNNINSWLPIYWLSTAMIGLGFDKNVMQHTCLKIDVHSCFSLSTHFFSRVKWGLFKIDVQNTHKHKRSYQFENKVNLYVAQAPLVVWVILRNMTPTLFSPWLKTGAPDWTHNVTQCNQKMFSCYLKL